MVAVIKGVFTNHNIEDAFNLYLPLFVNAPHQQPMTTRAGRGVVWLVTLLLCKVPTIAGNKPF